MRLLACVIQDNDLLNVTSKPIINTSLRTQFDKCINCLAVFKPNYIVSVWMCLIGLQLHLIQYEPKSFELVTSSVSVGLAMIIRVIFFHRMIIMMNTNCVNRRNNVGNAYCFNYDEPRTLESLLFSVISVINVTFSIV